MHGYTVRDAGRLIAGKEVSVSPSLSVPLSLYYLTPSPPPSISPFLSRSISRSLSLFLSLSLSLSFSLSFSLSLSLCLCLSLSLSLSCAEIFVRYETEGCT